MLKEKLLTGFFGREKLVQFAELDHTMDSSTICKASVKCRIIPFEKPVSI
jgi:hypothetical protein